MKKYNCLIVDDERLAQELIEGYLQKIPYLHHVASCSTAIAAMQQLQRETVDILFLDIQMPDLTGLEFLRLLKHQPATIFTTAYSEYALESYDLGVIDYLLKPIEFERFFQAVTKAINSLEKTVLAPPTPPLPTAETPTNPYFFVKSDTKLVRVELANVLYIEALQKYVRIHTTKERIITLLSLSKVLENLPASSFARIHRSYIVNIDRVDSIEGNMVKIGGHTLPISKGQRERFLKMIDAKGLFK